MKSFALRRANVLNVGRLFCLVVFVPFFMAFVFELVHQIVYRMMYTEFYCALNFIAMFVSILTTLEFQLLCPHESHTDFTICAEKLRVHFLMSHV